MSTQSRSFGLEPLLVSVPLAMYRALREAALQVTSVLPHGRVGLKLGWVFNELGRDVQGEGSRLRNAFVVDAACHEVLAAARATRDSDTILAAASAVDAFLAQRRAEIFRGHDLASQESRAAAAADTIEELSEATSAISRFAADPTPANEAKATKEIHEARHATTFFGGLLARRHWRSPMSA